MSTLAEALAPRSDQLNADDLIPGPRVLKITDARISKEERQTKIVVNFEGDQGKPWKPCKTMGRAMVIAWEITDEKQLIGKSVRVYRDPEVKFGDQGAVGGIRISHMSHIEKPAVMKLTVSQGKKAMFTFHPLVTDAAKPADASAYLEAIEACADQPTLKAWWKENYDTIPDANYDDVLTAFNNRLKAIKATPAPAADAPQEDEGAAALASQPADEVAGRDDSQMGEAPSLADAMKEIDGCEFVADVNTRTAALLPLLGEEDADALRNYAMERVAALGGGK